MPFNDPARARLQQFQVTAAYLASHPRLGELVEELEDSPEVYSAARESPNAHLLRKGIELPAGWSVKFSHDSPLTITVCVNGWCISYTFATIEVTTP